MNRSQSFPLLTASLFALALLISIASCGPGPTPGPPVLHLGRDTCAECGMIISESRFASALTIQVDGSPDHRLFDDIGDMLAYERSHPDLHILARYVHDYESQPSADWLNAQTATYLTSDTIKTPMASGIIAFADPARCQAAASAAGTRPQILADLQSRSRP